MSSLPPRPKPWETKAASSPAVSTTSTAAAAAPTVPASAFDSAIATSSSTAPALPDRPAGLGTEAGAMVPASGECAAAGAYVAEQADTGIRLRHRRVRKPLRHDRLRHVLHVALWRWVRRRARRIRRHVVVLVAVLPDGGLRRHGRLRVVWRHGGVRRVWRYGRVRCRWDGRARRGEC